jgi:acyl carrier protein
MMDNEIINNIQEVFREIFKDNMLVITPNTSAKDISMWDSFMHIQLIAAIEKKFYVKFSFNEVMLFNNVGDMVRVIEKKL